MGNINSKVLTDININKNEKYMIIILKSIKTAEDGTIEVPLKTIMKYFDVKSKDTVIAVLKSLESKSYIRINKTPGHSNRYKFIKDYLSDNGESNKENSCEKLVDFSDKKIFESSRKFSASSENTTTSGLKKVMGSSSENMTRCSLESRTSLENITGTSLEYRPSTISDKADKSLENTGFNRSIAMNSQYSNINNNNNNIYNNIYINILNKWNSLNLNNYPRLDIKIISSINNILLTYTESEIVQAMENYSKVYKSDHYYNHRWNLPLFLTRNNGISRFMNNGDMYLDYKAKHYSKYDEYEDLGIDLESYIE